jgi:hypothetical protein
MIPKLYNIAAKLCQITHSAPSPFRPRQGAPCMARPFRDPFVSKKFKPSIRPGQLFVMG